MSGHPGKTPWDEPVIRSPLQVDPVVRSLLRADPVERGHFYTFLANSDLLVQIVQQVDLVVQIVLQVDLVGDDSHSQARPCLRGKETARGAVLDEEEIEERRRKGGIWRPAVTPLCCGRCCAGLKPSRFLQGEAQLC